MQTSDWVSLASGLGGTILGAVIAAFFADRATKRTETKTLERDAASRVEADKASTIRMMIKLQLLTNSICTLQKYVADGFAHSETTKGQVPPSIAVKPTVGLTNRVPNFDIQEFSGLLSARRVDLISELLLLSQRWDSTETSMTRYSDMQLQRQDLFRQFSKVDVRSGSIVTSIPPDRMGDVEVRMRELDDLLLQIKSFLDVDAVTAGKLCIEVSAFARKHFADPNFFTLEPQSKPATAAT